MSKVEQLHGFSNYAKSILDELKKYDSCIQKKSLPQDKIPTEISNQVEIVRKKALEVVQDASSPVKIAVMGEFKASKTTLLGSLLGYAGMLPDSEIAATGNVTHLRIVQGKGSQTTKFRFSVEYFNQAEINQCLDFMLKELRKKDAIKQLPEAQFASLKNFSSKDPNVWKKYYKWYNEVIQINKAPGLKYAIQEVIVFVVSYIYYGKVVCGHKPIFIDPSTALGGLQLPSDPLSIINNKVETPKNKEQWTKFLQATFSLIGRINIEVEVSEKIWNISSIQGNNKNNKLVLLDFPGLGAIKSELRDKFLTVHEMENVQTILLLSRGTQPGGTRDYEILDWLQEERSNQNLDDFILIGVARFDELPGAKIEIDKLLNSTEPLTEEKIFKAIPALREAIQNSRKLIKENDKRIALLSAFAALEYSQKNLDSTIKIATPNVLDKLNEFKKTFPALNENWKQLIARLKKSEPDSMLVTWLEAFTKDGGLSRLRDLLEAHITTHGLDQLYEDVKIKVNNLLKEKQTLQQQLNSPSLRKLLASENPKLRILRKALTDLADNYKLLKTHLERNPLELGVQIDRTKTQSSLQYEFEQKVYFEIYRWSEWITLFQKIENGFVNLPQVNNDDVMDEIFKIPGEDNNAKTVTQSKELYPLFEETYHSISEFVKERIDISIKEFLDELSNNVVSLKVDSQQIDIKRIHNKIENCVTKKNEQEIEKQIKQLLFFASPNQWESILIKKVINKDSITLKKPEKLFTLPNKPPLRFAWSLDNKGANKTVALYDNHLFYIQGIQYEMSISLRDSCLQTLSKTSQLFNREIQSFLVNTISTLQMYLQNRERLKKIIGEEKTEDVNPDWLIILEGIVNSSHPL